MKNALTDLTATRLSALVETSDDAIIGVDLEGTVTSWNDGAERMFGLAASEMLGSSILRIVPPDRHDEERRLLATLCTGRGVRHWETERRRQDERIIHVSITASPIVASNGDVVGISKTARDITAIKQREEELARMSRFNEALSRVHQAIVRTPLRDDLLRDVCRALVEQGGFCMCWIGWHSAETRLLEPVAECGDEDGYLSQLRVSAVDDVAGRGPTGRAFREERPYVCNDMLADAATLPWREQAQRRGFRASAAFPIREGGQVRGVLSVYAREVGYFREQEISLIAAAAGDLSFGLDGIVRDEARRRAEADLRRERDFSDAVLSSLPGIFYLYDEEGRFLRWNRNFERVSGYGAEEIASMHPLELFSAEEGPAVASRIQAVFELGESTVEAGFVGKDQRSTPYHFTGVRAEIDGQACLVGVGIDVSERVRAEAALSASEARYRSLFEQAPDGILIADAQSCYLDANPSVCRMLGYTRDELIRLGPSDIVVQYQHGEVDAALDVIRQGQAYNRELHFRRKDGSTFPADVLATQMPDGRLLGVIRDVSQAKLAEQALRELNETLEHKVAARTEELERALERAEGADRLKSAFLATMSHELRTPLNSIIGFTGIVLQGLAGPLTPEQTKQLGMVRGSARHLLELINDVLDLSKIEAGQLQVHVERFDLAGLLQRVVLSMMPLAQKKGLTLELVVPTDLGELVSDRRRVEQILLNLTNNALKFTEQGGVTVTAERVHEPGPEGKPGPPSVRIGVADTGPGIEPFQLSKLFQPFSQLDTGLTRQHEGTGLGLAICRRLAALLDGEIGVTSEWSRGSTFTITLPVGRS
jgi:PAS domain S-box-containing protein